MEMILKVLLPVLLILFVLIAMGMPIYVGILASTIYLQVFVKVDKDWRNSSKRLEAYGYKLD